MRTIITLTLLLLITPVLFGQQSKFKSKVKNPQGTTTLKTKFKQINGLNNLKSSTISPYKMSSGMVKPDLDKVRGPVKKIMDGNNPVYLEVKLPNLKSASIKTPEQRFYSFFEATMPVSKLKDPYKSFQISKIETDALGMVHMRATQLFKGIEIHGTESTLHLDKEKERFTGRIKNIPEDFDVIPSLSPAEAVNITIEKLKKETKVRELTNSEKKFLEYEAPKTKLIVFENDDNNFSLAYEVEIRPNFLEVWKYYIDAKNGGTLRRYNATASDGPATAKAYDLNNVQRDINTYLEAGTYYLIDISETMFDASNFEGVIMTLDANNTSTQNLNYTYITSTNNTWNNKTAVSAHANTMATYKYLEKTFKRNSLSGSGSNILSFINITNDDGTSMDNAFWNGKAAYYGNGQDFKPLAGAQDVISHELGHGVVSNSANLEYYSQSGAINETFADFFGAMVDRDDWLVGEDIIKSGKPMRNMADPHNGGTSVYDGWQPRHMSEIVTGAELDNFTNRDNEGVHINSGIGNYCVYLLATSTSKEAAEQIFYRALTNYLTSTSNFLDFRVAAVQSARDLYGDNSFEMNKTKEAFDKVGIYSDEPPVEEKDYEVNEGGEDFMLIYNTDPDYSPTLYQYDLNETLLPLTSTPMKGKVSVTDDGAYAVYVSEDGNARLLILDPDNPEEIMLTEEGGWDNVAISKDGNRVALISTEVDASIYVIDIVNEADPYRQFVLYNPTTSHDNSSAGGVQYADEIEFDLTGEYIIYDAYNELSSSIFESIGYWDIGFLKVWDNTNNKWGDGSISKLYGTLAENVSIGNPVFSKNSPDIIAFDYFDEVNEDYAVIGADLLTSDIDIIYLNNTLGFPSFSRLDDVVTFTELDENNDEMVSAIYLEDNKISPSGDVIPLITMAKWPVFYSTGSRALGLPPTANFSVDYKNGDAPRIVRFIDASLNNPTTWEWTFPGGTPSVSNEQNPYVMYTNPGTYKVTLTVSNAYGENSITKESYIEVYPTASGEMQAGNISFYPNPAKNILNVSCADDFSVKLFTIDGKKVFEGKNRKTINISGFEPGMYFLEVESEKGRIKEKVIKN